jgi:deoxyribodipyrimidine photo-lyase
MATLLWYESDLRITDLGALDWAVRRREPVVPVFIWDEGASPGTGFAEGSASRWWLHHSLVALDASLRTLGSRLTIRRGNPAVVLAALAREVGADTVAYSTRSDPARIRRDRSVVDTLARTGVRSRGFAGEMLHEPEEIRTKTGGPYQVFTPFWRRLGPELGGYAPLPPPGAVPAPAQWPASETVADLNLLPRVDWAAGLREAWQPGEEGAVARLAEFLPDRVARYADRRDLPAEPGTSRLSPHLHFGEISPRQAWSLVEQAADPSTAEPCLRQLAWREFAHHLMVHFPATPNEPLKPAYAPFPWRDDPEGLRAWQRGRTGYPIVDAGMRELWHTGWMHNRVRMIVASFLTKDLLISWTEGADWFADTLVDADVANNTMGWQWAAGCGADAQPFFRIFNPVRQGQKFDAEGAYVRRWVPELRKLDNRYLHAPWEAPLAALRAAGVELGSSYPRPVVVHAEARDRALAAYEVIRRG